MDHNYCLCYCDEDEPKTASVNEIEDKVKKRILGSKTKEIVYRVHEFMKKEAEEHGHRVPYFNKVQARVAEATGVSNRTVANILKEARISKQLSGQVKKRSTFMKPKSDINDTCKAEMQRIIQLNPNITCQELRKKLIEANVGFQGSLTTLRRVIRRLGNKMAHGPGRGIIRMQLEISDEKVEEMDEGNLFGKTRMSQLYKTQNQKTRLNAALGDNMDQDYLTKNQFLTRGHLAPRADFPMRATQRASFHYVNTAPQWMRGNAGDWAALEDALRRHVHAHNVTLTVYTGTHEVLTLRSRAGKLEKIYLDTDANNNYIVPVPLYFYKLVYDSQKRTAAAFVSINSSYYNRTMLEHLTFCNDICEENPNYSWLRWRSNDGTHSFCCEYEEFVGKINYLPKLDVKGLFY